MNIDDSGTNLELPDQGSLDRRSGSGNLVGLGDWLALFQAFSMGVKDSVFADGLGSGDRVVHPKTVSHSDGSPSGKDHDGQPTPPAQTLNRSTTQANEPEFLETAR